MKFLTFLSLVLFTHLTVAANFSPILNIVNTETNEPSTLYLYIHNNSLSGLKLDTSNRVSQYSYNEVMKGATLLRKSGISIISIKGEQLTPKHGGNIRLKYLKNFSLYGSTYGTIWLKINKENGEWYLFDGVEKVSSLHLTPHAFGISSYYFK